MVTGVRVLVELHNEVERAMDQLRVLGAAEEFRTDFCLVSSLIGKLHFSCHQDE